MDAGLKAATKIRWEASQTLPGMSAQGAPVRRRQKIPFKTIRSSERSTPRTLFGKSGWITDHSKSVKSKRAILMPPQIGETESEQPRFGNPVYEFMT